MRRVLFSLLFAFIFLYAGAQAGRMNVDARGGEIIYQHETEKSFSLKHIPGAFEGKEPTNNIVMRMGQLERLNPPLSWRKELRYTEKVQIEKIANELHLQMWIEFKGLINTGSRSVYDFTEFLIPGAMNFRVQLQDAAGEVLFEHTVRNCDISTWSKENRIETFGFRLQDEYPHEGLRMRITEVVSPRPLLLFFHTHEQQEQLFRFLDKISEYEKDAASVKERARLVQNIKPDNPDRYREQLDLLESYKSDIDAIISKGWQQALNLSRNDPAGLTAALESFASRYKDTREALQQGLRTLDDAYYNRGMEFMRKADYDNALLWFNKAVEMNPNHARSHFQIANIDFRKGRLEKSASRANRILSTMNPDRSLTVEINSLLDEIQKSLSESYLKTYLSMVSDADREYLRGRIEEAFKTLNRASQYQKENSIYIRSNDHALLLADKITKGVSAEAEKDVKAGKYKEALNRYDDLTSIIRNNAPQIPVPGYIDKRRSEITELDVASMINQALMAMRKNDSRKIGFITNELIQESGKYNGLPTSGNINQMLYEYMMELYTYGQQLLHRRSYALAFEVLNHCLRLIGEYKLAAPPDLYRMLDEARNGVFTDLLMAGQQAMNSRDLEGAEFYLKEAMSFIQNKPSLTSRTALEAYKANLMNAYISEGRRQMSVMDYERAIVVLERAIESQYKFGILSTTNIPDLIMEAREGIGVRMLTNIDNLIKRQDYSDAIRSLGDVWIYIDDYGLSGSAYQKFINTGEDFYRDILRSIDQAIRAKSYNSALELLDNAKYLCDKYPIRCMSEDLQTTESNIRQGVYNSLIGDAEKAFGRGEIEQASGIMQQADNYRQQWNSFVTVTMEAGVVLGKIRQKNYQQAIETGISMLDRKDYRQALIHFDEAFTLEQEGGFTADKKLRDYRRTAALQAILAEAGQLEQILGQANYMATKDKMLQLMTMRAKYDLQDNKELEARFRSLQSRMVSAACLQQQAIFDEHLEKASLLEKQLQYISAGEELRLAAAAATKHPECYLSDSLPNRNLDRITPAIKYQEKLVASEKLLKDYRNSEALSRYVEAEALYNNGSLRNFGLNHEPLDNYALKQNLNFILSAAYYYKDKNDMSQAFRMIDALADKGYPSKQTRLLQEQIGYRFGQQDRTKYSGSTWKVAVLQYTGGKKFYKYFRSAYKKGWRSK